MNKRVICVDDEENILSAYKRHLRNKITLDTATGAEQALGLAANNTYAVVVSDLKMPGIDGIQFLSRMREKHPDSVRIMLTGQADLSTAIEAVNEGNIFRFLTKPCPPERLEKAIFDGIRQNQLITAERDLLEHTLSGSIKVLIEVLSLVSPSAFGRALSIQKIMRRIATAIGLESSWEFDIAGVLSQVGCVTVPTTIMDKVHKGIALTAQENAIFENHPGIGHDLIKNIPRLEEIAEIIEYQQKHFNGTGSPEDEKKMEDIPLGARALHIAIAYHDMIAKGRSQPEAIQLLHKKKSHYDPAIIAAMAKAFSREESFYLREVFLGDLVSGMLIAEDVFSNNGLMIISKGQEVTPFLIARLKNFKRTMGIREPLKVAIKQQ